MLKEVAVVHVAWVLEQLVFRDIEVGIGRVAWVGSVVVLGACPSNSDLQSNKSINKSNLFPFALISWDAICAKGIADVLKGAIFAIGRVTVAFKVFLRNHSLAYV
jgi:hypothetical protein